MFQIAIFAFFAFASIAYSQPPSPGGLPPFSTYDSDTFSSINLTNLNIHYDIPLRSLPGRGVPFHAHLVTDNVFGPPNYAYGAGSPIIFGGGGSSGAVTIVGGFGLLGTSPGYVNYATASSLQCLGPPDGQGNRVNYGTYSTYTNFTYSDPNGTLHSFPGVQVQSNLQGQSSQCQFFTSNPVSGTGQFTPGDGSPYVLYVTAAAGAPTTYVLDASSGMKNDSVDTYGNQNTYSSGVVNDSTGNPAMSFSGTSTEDSFSYEAPDGTTQNIVATLEQIPARALTVGCAGVTDQPFPDENWPTTEYILTKLAYPDGTAYSFGYDSLGRINSVTLPSGGQITYTFNGPNNGVSCIDGGNSGFTKTTPDGTWTYTRTYNATTRLWTTTVTDPQGSRSIYTFGGGLAAGILGGNSSQYEISRLQYHNVNGTQVLLKKTVTCYNGNFVNCDTNPSPTLIGNYPAPPTQKDIYTYTPGVSSPSLSELHFLYFNMLTEDKEYDFGTNVNAAPASTTLISDRTISYGNYRCISSDITTDKSGNTVAKTTSICDAHGNATSTTRWVQGTTNVTTAKTFDPSTGVLTSTVDGRNNTTTYTNGQCNGSFPSSITRGGLITSMTWNCIGEVLASKTDTNNNQTTTYLYENGGKANPMWRLLGTQFPDGGETTTTYNLTATPPNIVQTVLIDATHALTTQTNMDSQGRPVKRMVTSDPGGVDITDTTYDSLGRVGSVSNPYRTTSDPGYGVTSFAYDALNRKTVITNPDASKKQWCYNNTVTNGQTNCALHAASSTATWVDVADESGSDWWQTYDALGRLAIVKEPNGASSSPSMETDYSYDILGNLKTAIQWGGTNGSSGARSRSFYYDGLSRLIAANNPENRNISGAATQTCTGATGTWTNCYAYDANGNVISKTDNRGVVSSFSYDNLNRMLTASYSDGVTPAVANTYDSFTAWGQPRTNAKGRLVRSVTCGTNMSISGGSCEDDTFSYDGMGRINHIEGATPSQDGHAGYWLGLTYNAAGNISSITYPDGRVVNQTWNGADQVSEISDSSGYQYQTSQSSYWPNDAPQAIWYGNGVANGTYMNSRQQINEIGVVRIGASAPGDYSGNTSLTTNHYCFGPASPALSGTILACPALAGANNGNIWQIQDSLNATRTQSFTYDTLNRLKTFTTANNSASQTYTIDPWGNLSQSGTLNSVLTFDVNNKITSGNVGYDAGGNETAVNNGVTTVNYTYDADGHILTAASGTAKYFYSGLGDRVRKDLGSTSWTEYVYLNGQPMAELNNDGSWSDYIFANGQRIARADNYDMRIHMSGTNCSGCGSTNTFAGTQSLTAANGTVVQNGDLLTWRQYQDGVASGGISVAFNGNTIGTAGVLTAADGGLADADTRKGAWYVRVADLSAYKGDTISNLNLYNNQGGSPGNWDIYIGDVSLVHADGSFVPIYSRTINSLAQFSPGAAESNVSVITEKAMGFEPNSNTTYYSVNHLGSTNVTTDSGGWPTSSETYYPFGPEITSPSVINHYKFTGKERDQESANDYFGARYYASGMGRFMSPDWSASPTPVPYADLRDPQNLNLYSYVRNNPLSRADADGHCDDDGGKHGSFWCLLHAIGFVESDSEFRADQVNEARGFIRANRIDAIKVNGAWQPSSSSGDDDIASWWSDYNKSYANALGQGVSAATAFGALSGRIGGSSTPLTNAQVKDLAKWSGMEPVKDAPFDSHGQKVFKIGNRYFTPDVDGHIGGVWKEFDRQGNRIGTLDVNLNRIGK